jgi:hypothetical protein
MFSKTKNNPNAIPDDSKPGKKGKCSVFCFPDINADDLLGEEAQIEFKGFDNQQ